MLKIILITVAVIIAVFAVVVALQPAEFRVARSATMSAPAQVVYAQVEDLRKWQAWNPWQKIDPAMKLTFAGPATGPGASYTWVGNNQVGEGRLTIIESRPNDLVRIKLEFMNPFAATNTATFNFKSEGDRTTVIWSMEGRNNFIAKALHLVMNMDKMVGGQFEKGLADMKLVAEAAPKQ
ncbi:MAG: SRPBCC family protein [Betaproteobacteria bacterium]